MPKFKVEMSRKYYGYATIEVEAKDRNDARNKAYSRNDIEYENLQMEDDGDKVYNIYEA